MDQVIWEIAGLSTLYFIPEIFGNSFELDQGYKNNDRTSQAAGVVHS